MRVTEARLVLEAMITDRQNIGAMATVLEGQVDGIVITGGLAHSQYITGDSGAGRFYCPVLIYPGKRRWPPWQKGRCGTYRPRRGKALHG